MMTIPVSIRHTILFLILPATCAAATRVEELEQVLRRDPQNVAACTALARVYVQRLHETGDVTWESRADSLASAALASDSTNVDALVLRATIQLSRHHFADALQTGQRAGATATDALAVVADAQIELGRDTDALATLQRLADARPGQPAYARISYYRELHGDREGAIDAMQRAWDAAGSPADAAWCAAHLGLLLLGRGDVDRAAASFDHALALNPRSALALAGQARVAAARGEYPRAIALYRSAIAIQPLAEHLVALGDLLALCDDPRDAQREYDGALQLIDAERRLGVDIDVDGAILEADHAFRDDLPARVRAARDRRPSPMADHALAWVLHRAGRTEEAYAAMTRGLRWGTDDATMLCHAGLIAAAAGDQATARTWLARALQPSGALSPLEAATAREAVRRLAHP